MVGSSDAPEDVSGLLHLVLSEVVHNLSALTVSAVLHQLLHCASVTVAKCSRARARGEEGREDRNGYSVRGHYGTLKAIQDNVKRIHEWQL